LEQNAAIGAWHDQPELSNDPPLPLCVPAWDGPEVGGGATPVLGTPPVLGTAPVCGGVEGTEGVPNLGRRASTGETKPAESD
jgi:hypothetical protein